MTGWSIRVRLTAWFAGVLGIVLMVAAAATGWSLRESVHETVDQGLASRVDAIARFLNEPGTSQSFEELREDLREYVALDPGWNLLRIRDAQGAQLYRSEAFDPQAAADLSAPPAPAPAPARYQDLVMRGRAVRLLTARVDIRRQWYAIDVAMPMAEMREAQDEFGWTVLLLIPCAILGAALGGYWISGRALAPVDRIAATARAITARDLGRRLEVPTTGDELQRLSETLNQMLGRLETTFAEMRRFTADASHELRTPVSLIRTTAEVALRRPRPADEYREALEAVLREAERTSTLVEDLLTLTRADSGVDPPPPAAIDLRDLVDQLHAQVATLCDGRRLEYRADLPAQPVFVAGDRATLVRLVLALVDNAVKYTPAPGSVCVRLSGGVGGAQLDVVDTGIGISAADLPYVFDRFYRADKARSRDAGGAGLGLSIARGIVDRQGGRITIDSEPGHGCRVRVCWLAVPPSAQA